MHGVLLIVKANWKLKCSWRVFEALVNKASKDSTKKKNNIYSNGECLSSCFRDSVQMYFVNNIMVIIS